jgi:hypothetical protein
MSNSSHSVLFKHQDDPETGDQYMELHVICRLGMGVALVERLLKTTMLPSAEAFDPDGLALARTVNTMADQL